MTAAPTGADGCVDSVHGWLSDLPVAVLGFDSSGACQTWNMPAWRLFGDELAEMTRDGLSERVVRSGGSLRLHVEHGVSPEPGALNWAVVTEVRADGDVVEQLAHQALHDHLTGLPNRLLLGDRVKHGLSRASRSGRYVAVVFLDLDHFKLVNDTQGHAEGDLLLKAVSDRLSGVVRADDTVARFGGDEFVVVFEDVSSHRDAAELAERLTAVFAEPFVLGEERFFVSASLGVALGGPDASTEALLRDADAAMYHAKVDGRGRVKFFDDEIRARAEWRRETQNALHRAVKDGGFRLEYQPIVALDAGWVVGAEALLRWEHPDWGPVPPADFVPVAEEAGLIATIGEWVLSESCRQLAAWRSELADVPLFMSVNVSARQLKPGIGETVAAAASRHRLDPSSLVLEITEGSVMSEVNSCAGALQEVRATGAHIALDDFGVGYSSMNYLKRFPVDIIKVGKAFVSGLGRDASDSAIVTAIAGIARGLKVSVVAVGVETDDQLYALRRLGCQQAQGYAFSRPLEPAAFAELVRERPRW
ncbi:MAG TPA: EAL domain-containing protein [Acidimicrobiales bacterium]|nr:EAL domain-containing protein [Acidimicrobiales bacterium]